MNREPQEIVLQGGSGCGHNVVGDALVSQQNFGVRYDLDPETGLISNRQHDLYGEAVAGRIPVFANPKGGVAASWALAGLAERGIAPPRHHLSQGPLRDHQDGRSVHARSI